MAGCASQKTSSSDSGNKNPIEEISSSVTEEKTLIEDIIEDSTIKSRELKRLIESDNDDYLLIDVRTSREYRSGHIPGAINIPHTEIRKKVEKIPLDKIIIVYCKVGGRAEIAKKSLQEMGYKKVFNFGGIRDYKYEIKNRSN